MCFSSNNDHFLMGNKFVISFRIFIIQRLFFSVWFLVGIFLENIFLTCGLNSFQQLEISIPFSRFISPFGDMFVLGFRQSIKRASLIFLLLQCDSKSRNTLFSNQFRVSCFCGYVVQFHWFVDCI